MELNREILECMGTLRRRLRAEQALDIRLNQPDAISAMLSACLASTDEQTRQLGERLARLSERPLQAASKPTPPAEPVHLPTASKGSVRIYRGQRVYV